MTLEEKELYEGDYDPKDPFGMEKNPPDRLEVPQGLTVNIRRVNEKGKIMSVSINEPGQGYVDGDIVAVAGGNGNAYLRVRVSDTNKWTTEYIPPRFS